ncbi:hypothetical protein Taro_027759 [Colocasia esculenta]|uniref:Methyltransferase type 11 domain-containing protein n=1 Tax=Colocasia esculenta TaxID=4460 RepID=A0A843VV92_COLES|nr:hypothetical protein [Colocasia esculenta]
MDSSHRSPFARNLLFLLLLVSSNLLTFHLFSSSSSDSASSRFSAAPSRTTAASARPPPPELPPEFLAFTSPQRLPFGHNPNFESDHMNPPVGVHCTLFPEDLRKFMAYPVNGSCPDDEAHAQNLLLKGCEPLPRRRCRPAAAPSAVDPSPLPQSLWSIPPDSSVVWTAYSCKDYACLVDRKTHPGFDDCKDCFDLEGRERHRWITPSTNPIDFTIDEVLALKPPGTIRIGLDLGGGGATFAVRMRERNVTVVTTSMNLNGPFNNFIAARGVVPLYLSISQRLPFFDNTLDIVHSMHVLSSWIPDTLLHFILFDIYRVLRPGGVFWLDHFFFTEHQLATYEPMMNGVGFRRLKWEVGRKLDRGPELKEMYISALLEKPLKNSWGS